MCRPLIWCVLPKPKTCVQVFCPSCNNCKAFQCHLLQTEVLASLLIHLKCLEVGRGWGRDVTSLTRTDWLADQWMHSPSLFPIPLPIPFIVGTPLPFGIKYTQVPGIDYGNALSLLMSKIYFRCKWIRYLLHIYNLCIMHMYTYKLFNMHIIAYIGHNIYFLCIFAFYDLNSIPVWWWGGG